MSRPDRQQRRERLRQLKREQMNAAFAALPATDEQLQQFFDGVLLSLQQSGCDHTRRFAIEQIHHIGLNESRVLGWLDDNSGFCDCEIQANARQAWEVCRDGRSVL
ncbi:MAG: DUF2695 domain-containing protein [Planctomycetaceae bacterium]|nr:DUF2695 domain-containing protein [Planctomycetaceae bacterium]